MKKYYIVYLSVLTLFLFTSVVSGNDVVEWIFETGDRVIARPVIRNDSLFIGSLDGNFYVIDITDGTELWHYTTGNEIRTTAALYENIICFESGNVLYGLGTDGSLLWTETLYDGALLNEHDQWDCFRSSPELLDSVAYIGSEEGLVIGVNVKTGERVFEAQTPEANATIETTPAIYSNKVYVGDWFGVFSVFDLTTQNLVWQYDTKTDNTYSWVNAIVSQPLIYRDTVYFGGRNCNLYAFNPETGEQFWKYHQPSSMWLFGGPVVSDDILYVGSSFQQVIYAFNPDEPEMLWQTNVYGLNYGDPVVHDDYILIGTGNTGDINSGSLTIVNKQSHQIEERFDVNGWVETPLYYNGIIYFGCADGNVYAINEQALLSILRPNTIIKDASDIDLGQLENAGSIETSFYIHNTGEGNDSITYIGSYGFATVEPGNYILLPDDSVEVSVTINLSVFAPGNKDIAIEYQSHHSMIQPSILSKGIVFEITEAVSAVSNDNMMQFSIGQNYPNPAAGQTFLTYSLDRDCFVQLELYDLLGNKVASLVNAINTAGQHTLQFDATSFKNGTYFYVFRADHSVIIRKMTVLNNKE